ncbi:hypothetical protein C7M84_011014 [Penaeus vannamei]|uniref:Uncharacterized protein n=1 Tax=Penaeus vannamei TaxID=6689 RepID=A0A423T2C9_PENVA|nr:hypothetical protein C7M84_011014 [Penaeus vannamei]
MSGYIRTVSSAHRHIVLDLHRDMKILVLTALVASCCAAPQVYPAVSAPSALVYAQSNSPAVMKIPEPGINLGAPLAARAPVAPVVAAPVPFVQSAAPIPVAPAAPLLKTAAVRPSRGRPIPRPGRGRPVFLRPLRRPQHRVETRDYLGRTSGSFAYVDPEGDVQVRKYAAAPLSGFKVAASDLVEDTPAVAQVKSALARAHQAANALVTAA